MEALKKDNAELKEMLRKKFDQELENNTKCNRLECEVEILKKAQNDIKEEYENKIETLEIKSDELKKTLKEHLLLQELLLENLKKSQNDNKNNLKGEYEDKIETSEKEIVELKKMLKEQSDQKLETQSKCDRLQCEVETLKKEQNEIKNNLKGAYEDEIETLKKEIVELKKRMLKEQSDQKLVLSLSNDFEFDNEEIIKNEVKEEDIEQDGIANINMDETNTSNSVSPSGGSTKPVSENDTSPKGEDLSGGIDDETSGDLNDSNLKDVSKFTEKRKVMPLKIKRGQISGTITTPSTILQSGIDDETSADLDDTMTVYAAPGSEHCEEPHTQVVRANPAQLVVTDRPAGQSSILFQSVASPAGNPMQISEQEVLDAIKGKKCNKCDEILNMTNGKMLRHFTSKHFSEEVFGKYPPPKNFGKAFKCTLCDSNNPKEFDGIGKKQRYIRHIGAVHRKVLDFISLEDFESPQDALPILGEHLSGEIDQKTPSSILQSGIDDKTTGDLGDTNLKDAPISGSITTPSPQEWKPFKRYFKPLSLGWVREVIYDKKEDGSLYPNAKEVIYHVPIWMQFGTKPRTFKSVAELEPFLNNLPTSTLDNFSFRPYPLNASKEQEIVHAFDEAVEIFLPSFESMEKMVATEPLSPFFKPLNSGWVREVIYNKKKDGSRYPLRGNKVIYHAPIWLQSETQPKTFESEYRLGLFLDNFILFTQNFTFRPEPLKAPKDQEIVHAIDEVVEIFPPKFESIENMVASKPILPLKRKKRVKKQSHQSDKPLAKRRKARNGKETSSSNDEESSEDDSDSSTSSSDYEEDPLDVTNTGRKRRNAAKRASERLSSQVWLCSNCEKTKHDKLCKKCFLKCSIDEESSIDYSLAKRRNTKNGKETSSSHDEESSEDDGDSSVESLESIENVL